MNTKGMGFTCTRCIRGSGIPALDHDQSCRYCSWMRRYFRNSSDVADVENFALRSRCSGRLDGTHHGGCRWLSLGSGDDRDN